MIGPSDADNVSCSRQMCPPPTSQPDPHTLAHPLVTPTPNLCAQSNKLSEPHISIHTNPWISHIRKKHIHSTLFMYLMDVPHSRCYHERIKAVSLQWCRLPASFLLTWYKATISTPDPHTSKFPYLYLAEAPIQHHPRVCCECASRPLQP